MDKCDGLEPGGGYTDHPQSKGPHEHEEEKGSPVKRERVPCKGIGTADSTVRDGVVESMIALV